MSALLQRPPEPLELLGAQRPRPVVAAPAALLGCKPERVQYDEQRVYVFRRISKADVTIDLMHVGYQQAINGETDAWTGSAAFGYTVNPRTRLVADMEYSQNPDFNSDVRAMFSVVYSFHLPLEPRAKPKAAPQQQEPKPARGKKGGRAGARRERS